MFSAPYRFGFFFKISKSARSELSQLNSVRSVRSDRITNLEKLDHEFRHPLPRSRAIISSDTLVAQFSFKIYTYVPNCRQLTDVGVGKGPLFWSPKAV